MFETGIDSLQAQNSLKVAFIVYKSLDFFAFSRVEGLAVSISKVESLAVSISKV